MFRSCKFGVDVDCKVFDGNLGMNCDVVDFYCRGKIPFGGYEYAFDFGRVCVEFPFL